MAALDVERALRQLAQHSGHEVALVATAGGLALRTEGHGVSTSISGLDSAAELLASAAEHLARRCAVRHESRQALALLALANDLEGEHAG